MGRGRAKGSVGECLLSPHPPPSAAEPKPVGAVSSSYPAAAAHSARKLGQGTRLQRILQVPRSGSARGQRYARGRGGPSGPAAQRGPRGRSGAPAAAAATGASAKRYSRGMGAGSQLCRPEAAHRSLLPTVAGGGPLSLSVLGVHFGARGSKLDAKFTFNSLSCVERIACLFPKNLKRFSLFIRFRENLLSLSILQIEFQNLSKRQTFNQLKKFLQIRFLPCRERFPRLRLILKVYGRQLIFFFLPKGLCNYLNKVCKVIKCADFFLLWQRLVQPPVVFTHILPQVPCYSEPSPCLKYGGDCYVICILIKTNMTRYKLQGTLEKQLCLM